jgi:hypothetical protein
MQVPRIEIPVFVSCPSDLNRVQEKSAEMIRARLGRHHLAWRALGRNEYPDELPLREVLRMVRHCSGGVILGFEQFRAPSGMFKRGTKLEEKHRKPVVMPTPWNQLEAGILFSQELPILIFKEEGIRGGVFDVGTSEIFIHRMPTPKMERSARDSLEMVFRKWSSKVYAHYYGR